MFHRKSNFSRLHRPLGIEFIFAENGIRALKTDVSRIPGAEASLPLKTRILAVLGEHGALPTKELADTLEASTSVVRVVLNRLKGQDRVVKLPGGKWGVKAEEEVPF